MPGHDMVTVLGLVSFRVYPTLMGGQKGVALFYTHLGSYVNTVLAVSSDNEQAGELTAEKILFSNRKMLLNFFRVRTLVELAMSTKADVIIAEHSYTGWIAWQLSKRTGKPFIIHSHNIESKRFRQMGRWWWRLYHRYEGWIHRKADHNFFISEEERAFAEKEFRLQPSKCSVVTYGVTNREINPDKKALRRKLGLPEEKRILLFNGTLDYAPNHNAVHCLIEQIDPLLQQQLDNYLIIITGNRASSKLLGKMKSCPSLLYAGYVADVNEYYQAADLFINPVANDTGVKTKLIEAIANHCTSISTESGASGIIRERCGPKLVTVPDNDWREFTNEIMAVIKKPPAPTPASFYDYYEWSNIVKKAAAEINQLAHR